MSDEPQTPLDFALRYAARGWAVFPLHEMRAPGACSCGRECGSPGKHPYTEKGVHDASRDEAAIRAWWARWPQANVGIATGRVSGLVVLDIDPRHDGDESLAALEAERGALPETPVSLTGGGGAHYLFAHPGEGDVPNRVNLAGHTGVDLKGDGGYIVAPPSNHASGREYAWNVQLHPDDVALAACPPWILELAVQGAAGPRAGVELEGWDGVEPDWLAPLLAAQPKVRERFDRVAHDLRDPSPSGVDQSLATLCAMVQLEPARIEIVLYASRRRAQLPGKRKTYYASTIGRALATAKERPARVNGAQELGAFVNTDVANAHRLAKAFGNDVRWCSGIGWIVWRESRWVADETAAQAIAMRLGRSINAEAADASREAAETGDETKRDRLNALAKCLTDWARRSEDAGRVRAAMQLARPLLEVDEKAIDGDPWLLNCANGTVDLRSGVLREHRREDYITKTTGILYDEKAELPLWLQVLERALPDEEARRFLQKCAGYTACGQCGEDVLLLIHGPTRTAKGTVQNAIANALGEYASTAGLEDLTERDSRRGGGGARPEIAKLRGSRMVSIYETRARMRLEAAMVKSLAGSDPITVRDLYSKPITFVPQFTLWIATNHRPRVPEDDDALWERIRELPFVAQIPEDERDPEVRKVLSDPSVGGPVVLRWMVEGALAYQREGLRAPARVREATAGYRGEMDPIRDFLEACCSLGVGRYTPASALRIAYETWCKESGERPLGARNFADALHRHACEQTRNMSTRGWNGIGLLRDQSAHSDHRISDVI